jgi:hypothetical protein
MAIVQLISRARTASAATASRPMRAWVKPRLAGPLDATRAALAAIKARHDEGVKAHDG